MDRINSNILKIKNCLPNKVGIVAATKSRSIEEIKSAVNAGIKIIGESYVKEAKEKYPFIRGLAEIHMIGHLQSNKVKDAVRIFDMIQTLDSLKLAKEINKKSGKRMPVLVEVNIGMEKKKTGILPSDVESFLNDVSSFENIKVKGLMAMGPYFKDREEYRHLFRKMKNIFDSVKNKRIMNISMEILSMGMSESYKIAAEEGANMVRIGKSIFE